MFAVEGGQSYKWFGISDPGDTIYLSSTTSEEVYFSPPAPNISGYRFGLTLPGIALAILQ